MSLPVPLLYLIGDRAYCGDTRRWLDLCEAAIVPGNATRGLVLQLRAKNLSDSRCRRALVRARQRLGPAGVPLLANCATAEALDLGFHGVHWPETTIPPAAEQVPPGFTRGASVHSPLAARRAEDAGADFVLFGPVYNPGSKPGDGVGLGSLHRVVKSVGIPVLAVGGITAVRVAACLAEGAHGVGVVSAVFGASEPGAAVDRLYSALRPSAGSRGLRPA